MASASACAARSALEPRGRSIVAPDGSWAAVVSQVAPGPVDVELRRRRPRHRRLGRDAEVRDLGRGRARGGHRAVSRVSAGASTGAGRRPAPDRRQHRARARARSRCRRRRRAARPRAARSPAHHRGARRRGDRAAHGARAPALPAPPSDPNAAATFGRYTLLDRLGAGGMAEVYTAVTFGAEGFRRTFVVKRLRAELARDARGRRAVHRRGQARLDAGALEHHPGVRLRQGRRRVLPGAGVHPRARHAAASPRAWSSATAPRCRLPWSCTWRTRR